MKSRVLLLVTIATIFRSGDTRALDLSVERIYEEEGLATAIVKLTNDDAADGYRVIALDYTWMDHGAGVFRAADSITNLQFQETDYVEMKTRSRGKKFDNVFCRVLSAEMNPPSANR